MKTEMPIAVSMSDGVLAREFAAAMNDPRRDLLDEIAEARRERDAAAVKDAERESAINPQRYEPYIAARSRLAALEVKLKEEAR